MLKQLMKSPVIVLAVGGLLVFAYLTFGDDLINDFFGSPNQAFALENSSNCFSKEQSLEKDIRQGVSICFENNLEEIHYEYYTISPENGKTAGLADQEKFKEFFTSQSLETDIASMHDQEDEASELRQVKGVNNLLADKVKVVIEKDLENFGSNW